MISDRDPRFTSHFGKALSEKLGIEWNLSTAFHPQTDGLSERKNQWIEQYLRLVMSNDPKVQPHAQLRQSITNPQRISRVTHTSDDQESRRRHSSAQQGHQSERTTPSTIPPPRTGVVRRVPPETPPPEGQTHPKMSRPVQNHSRNIPGGLPTRPTPKLENSQRVPRLPPNSIS